MRLIRPTSQAIWLSMVLGLTFGCGRPLNTGIDGSVDSGGDSPSMADTGSAAFDGVNSGKDADSPTRQDGSPDGNKTIVDVGIGEGAPEIPCNEDKLPDPESTWEFFEFCVDDDSAQVAEVLSILEPLGEHGFYYNKGSSGRIHCDTEAQYLFWAIAPDAPREILCQLSLLPYIERIAGSFYP